ncbi:MAG: hypothetical protein ACFCUW_11235 [Kiloniellaceae bacterium]
MSFKKFSAAQSPPGNDAAATPKQAASPVQPAKQAVPKPDATTPKS